MPDLNKILEDTRPAIEAGLADAQRELAELDGRKRELEALIARANAALGQTDSGAPREPRRKLHEAIELVLREAPDQSMTVQEIAREINERGLYEKHDGSAIEPNQIHARAGSKTYRHLFSKEAGVVSLRVD